MDDGQVGAAFEWLQTLIDITSSNDKLSFELEDAYGAIAAAAQRAGSLRSQHAILERGRRMFRKAGYARLSARCLHDMAGHSAAADDLAGMKRLFDRAISERRRTRDSEGVAWSQNSMAFHYIEAGRVRDALAPLGRVAQAVGSGEVTASQRAVSTNLASLERMLGKQPPTPKAAKWWWNLAERRCESSTPFVFAPDRAVRTALALESRLRPKAAVDAARRVAGLARSTNWRDEVRGDVLLRAARVALAAEEVDLARELIDSVRSGTGPCGSHLAARQQALRAAYHAHSNDASAFDDRARVAVDSMRELGHRSGLLDVLSLVAARDVAESAQLEVLRAELDQLRRSGGPGGSGGSVSSSKVGTMPADAGDHFIVFERGWDADAERIRVLDRVGGGESLLDVRWKPRNVTLNGLGLGLLGGYITVHSMRYGRGAGASGALGTSTLDQLGNYVPITTQGVWQVTKNGALRYQSR